MVTRTLALAAFTAMTPMAAFAQSNLPAPVESSELRQLDAWSVGAISRADGALAADLWSRSDPAMLATVLDGLPAIYDSPATQALARRALLSSGDAPAGDATLAARKRFEALGKMGAADDLAIMAAGAGSGLNDPGIAMFAAQAELARGRRNEACARGRTANTGETPPPFFLRLRAYCAAAVGDRAAADLALELARAQNAADAWYTGAVAAAGGAPSARPPAANYDNSLSSALSLAGNLRPGRNPLNNSSTLALLTLARAENAPQPHRATAAALAYIRGVLPATEARAILRATPAEVTTGLPLLMTIDRRVQAATPGSVEAAAAVAELLRRASSPAEFTRFATFYKDEIASFASAPDNAAAILFARAAIAVGDVQNAQRLAAATRAAGVDEAVLAPIDTALAVLAGTHSNQAAMVVQRRIDAAGANATLRRSAARDVTILAALGAPVDETVQGFLATNAPQGGRRADAGAIAALTGAAERGAVGEGALLAVNAAGQAGPARLDAESLDRIIRALRALRLEDDARRIAVEAILAGAPS